MSDAIALPPNWPETPPRLSAERVHLRPITQEDAHAVYDLFKDPATARMTGSIPIPFLPQAANGWISCRTGRFARGDGVEWVIGDNETRAFLGVCGLFRRTKTSPWEIAYSVSQQARGKGYATEAAIMIRRWACETLDAKYLVAGHYADNPASGAVLRKIGFVRVGEPQMMYSLARGEKSEGYTYAWPADLAEGLALGALH